MSYASIMVHIDADARREHIVRAATALAHRFASNLIGVSAIPIRAPFITDGMIVSVASDTEIDGMRERLQAKEHWFRQRAAPLHRVPEWRSELDFPTEFLISQSRCADLIMVNPNREFHGVYSSLDAAGLILRAGRPVLVVPTEVESVRAERVVIGWKDTREARRAIADALPFMHEATQVTVAEVRTEGEDEAAARRSVDDIVRYLARHRIKVDAKVFLQPESSIAARLIRLAQDEGADLLVTGAYGHSRLGEWVFGGVTHELLTKCPVCSLMSH
jgi:nucleotide-binding universal stress UspA family protein